MKVIKSDGRYNFFKHGFNTILEFRVRIRDERDQYYNLTKALDELYGAYRTFDAARIQYKLNDDYRLQLMSDNKRRRIYLKNESVVSLLLLKMETKA